MRAHRVAAGLAVAAAVALVAAGCGSGSNAGSSGLGGAAAVAPSSAVAFLALDTESSSGQWAEVDELLDEFPGYDTVLANLRKTFQRRTKLSWADDVKPALGSELDLVALPGKQPQLVGLTRGGDQAKLDVLLHALDKNIKVEQIDGWTVFSKSQAALETVKIATTKLADNNTYRAAVAKLADDALVRAYANGTEAPQLLASLGRQSPSVSTPPFAWASADLVTSGAGVRVLAYSQDNSLRGVSARVRPVPPAPYASSLVDEIPAGALLVADFPVTPGEFQYSDPTTLPDMLKKFVAASPTFLAELDDILGGETSVYVRPGTPMPEVTIVTQPSDTQLAVQTLADVLKTIHADIPIVHDVVGGQLIISTSRQAIADFRSAGPKLSADPSFTAAVSASSMPAETTGFVYSDLTTAVPVVRKLAPFLGLKLPAVASTGLGSLQSLTAYGTRAGDEATFTVSLRVR